MGEGPRGSNGACFTLCQISVTPSTTHNQTGPLWCWFRSGWVCVCSRPLWVSPTTSPVRLGVSPAAAQPPRVFSIRGLRLYVPELEPWVAWSASLPTVCLVYLCANVGPLGLLAAVLPAQSHKPPLSWVCQRLPCHESSGPAACVRPSYQSGWMFLLYLLGCRTSIHLIFCQFWLFFVFKLLLSFFWLCEEA